MGRKPFGRKQKSLFRLFLNVNQAFSYNAPFGKKERVCLESQLPFLPFTRVLVELYLFLLPQLGYLLLAVLQLLVDGLLLLGQPLLVPRHLLPVLLRLRVVRR